jgi:hypothetical protein
MNHIWDISLVLFVLKAAQEDVLRAGSVRGQAAGSGISTPAMDLSTSTCNGRQSIELPRQLLFQSLDIQGSYGILGISDFSRGRQCAVCTRIGHTNIKVQTTRQNRQGTCHQIPGPGFCCCGWQSAAGTRIGHTKMINTSRTDISTSTKYCVS